MTDIFCAVNTFSGVDSSQLCHYMYIEDMLALMIYSAKMILMDLMEIPR